jgi:hypothetical protein
MWTAAGRPAAAGSGCSSGVEHNLAKVGVGGSNPLARSNSVKTVERMTPEPFLD